MSHERCFACGANVPLSTGPTHGYMSSSPGCWAAYGAVLAREYADPELFERSHRLTVDAYAVQHTGDLSAQRTRQSLWIHLTSLYAVLELDWRHQRATRLLQTLAGRAFTRPRVSPGTFEVAVDVVWSRPVSDHDKMVERWARSALATWQRVDADTMTVIRRLIAAASQ